MSNNTPKPSPARQHENDKNKPIHKAEKGQKKQQGKRKGFTSSNYRTQKCEFYNKGHCTKGQECTYSHDFTPEASRKMCKFYLAGACSKETQCPYSHNTAVYPCRFHHLEGNCGHGSECKFSHQHLTDTQLQEFATDNKELVLKLNQDNKLTAPVRDKIEFIREEAAKKEERTLPPLATSQPQPRPTLKDDPRKRVMKSFNRQKQPLPPKQEAKPLGSFQVGCRGEGDILKERVLQFLFSYY